MRRSDYQRPTSSMELQHVRNHNSQFTHQGAFLDRMSVVRFEMFLLPCRTGRLSAIGYYVR